MTNPLSQMRKMLSSSENSDSTSQSEDQTRSPKEQQEFLAWVMSEFKRVKNERWREERQWYLNLAFHSGKQNVTVIDGKSSAYKLHTPPAPYYRARPVINRIRPLIRTEVAKLTSQKPSAYVVPASSEDRDLYAAQAGEQLWEHTYTNKKVHNKLRRAVWWASVTGNGIIKNYWNDDLMHDEEAGIMGEQCIEVITPFHFFVSDLTIEDLEDQPFVIHAANRSQEEVEMSYGMSFKEDKPSGGELLDETFVTAIGVDPQIQKNPKQVLVLEMWVKPGRLKKFPHGGMITVAGDKIVNEYVGWPYEHKQYPFIHIPHIETGKFYRESTVTDLIPLQREYNRTRGQIIEAKNKAAKPQLAAEQGSMDPNKMTNEPGQIIFYRPGFQPPQPIPLQSLPSYVLEEQDRIKMDMDEISGQHEVSRGQVPAGVTAATAISYLQEQDDTKLSDTYDSIEEGMEKLAHQTLCYIKQFWDVPRMVKVTGDDQSFDVMAFKGSDLGDNTDIRMEGGSSLPTSRAAKQAFVMDLMKMGFIDPNKGLEVMEIGGINRIYEEIQVDARQAQRENLRMASVTEEVMVQHEQAEMALIQQDPIFQQKAEMGVILEGPDGELIDISAVEAGGPPVPIEAPLLVPVNSWDDNRLHIEQHNKYRKSQAFENLSPVAKELFEAHVNAHVSAIMVGAQGAMGLTPEAMAMANNPETMTEMTYREQSEPQGSGPTEQAMPQEQMIPPEAGMESM